MSGCLVWQDARVRLRGGVLPETILLLSLLSVAWTAMKHFHQRGLIHIRRRINVSLAQSASARPNIIFEDAVGICVPSHHWMRRIYKARSILRILVWRFQGSRLMEVYVERDRKGDLTFQTEHGVLTCYHIAHCEYWKSNYENKTPLTAISEDTNGSSAESNKHERSS